MECKWRCWAQWVLAVGDCNTPQLGVLNTIWRFKFGQNYQATRVALCSFSRASSPWSSWPRTPLTRAHDARPRPCRPCLARRPARSSPEPSPCYLSRPRLSLSLSRERRLPWPPLASPLVGLPRSSLFHPFSRPNDPVASFLGLHRCSPTRLPPSRAARPPQPPPTAAVGATAPRRSPFRSPPAPIKPT